MSAVVRHSSDGTGAVHISSYAQQAAEATRIRTEFKGVRPGLTTGLKSLDERTVGVFDSGRLTVVAGSSGGGKTAIAAQMAVAFGAQVPTYWLSLEDDPADAVNRAIANVGSVSVGDVRRGFRDGVVDSSVNEAADAISELSLWTQHRDGTVLSLSQDIAAWAQEHGRHDLPIRGAVIVDQLSHISRPSPSEREALTRIDCTPPKTGAADHEILEFQTLVLRKLAQKLGLTIVLMHQLNQHRSASGQIEMGSLRGSQGIVHKCDAVIGLQVGSNTPSTDDSAFSGNGQPTGGSALSDIVCLKNRSGESGWTIQAWFDGRLQRWSEASDMMRPTPVAWKKQAAPTGRAVEMMAEMRSMLSSFEAARFTGTAPAITAAPAPAPVVEITDEDDWNPDDLSAPAEEDWS